MANKIPAALAAFLRKHKGVSEIGGSQDGGDSWNPKVGDAISGRIVDWKGEVGQYKQNLIVLDTAKGRMTVWLNSVLDSRIDKGDIGKDVAILFDSTIKAKKKNRSDTKIFKVYMTGGAKVQKSPKARKAGKRK